MAKSTFSPQYKRVADTVRTRIHLGDYALKSIPSERILAKELGVNYMTVRRGLNILEKEKLLVRQPNGRVRVRRTRQEGKSLLNIAYLVPTIMSYDVEMWRLALETAVEKIGGSLRTILFVHWNDPLLLDAIEGFDGVFLRPEPEGIPEEVSARLRRPEHPVIVVDQNLSDLGIPSIQLFPPASVQRLLDHLNSVGRRKIACLNVEPDHEPIKQRINQWRLWMIAHGFRAPLINEPVKPHALAITSAYTVMKSVLEKGAPEFDGLFCTTMAAAMGAVRACLDAGIRPGHDLAICAANGEGISAMLYPTMTSLEAPDPVPYIQYCLEWIAKGNSHWEGPLLLQPDQIPMYIGESTVPRAEGIVPPPPKAARGAKRPSV